MQKIVLLIMWFIFVLSCKNQVNASWHIEEVDAPRTFYQVYGRSMAISEDGIVHVTYGRDHLYHAYYDGDAWRYETVDPSNRTGYIASLAISSSGKVHIVYTGQDWDGSFLKYASNVSGSWVIETLDNIYASFDFSFAIDSDDKVHISYGSFDHVLKYATNASGSWVVETVAGSVGGYSSSSLALDSSDKVHISFLTYESLTYTESLTYATNSSGSWTTEVVDSGYHMRWTSIAVDANNKVHISYDVSHGISALKYATNSSGIWTTEIVVSNYVSYPSLVLDVNNKAHISYFDSQSYDLKYATNASGTWSTMKVQSSTWDRWSEGLQSSIALANSEKVRISYVDYDADLKYAWCDAECGYTSNWHIEGIDESRVVGYYNSIALDSDDKAHISYGGSSDLKYATNTSGTWIPETIDQHNSEYISLALDSNDKAHISSYAAYHTNVTGSWIKETPGIQMFTSLALDANNGVHISYYVESGEDLKYVTNATGSWVTETVDSLGNAGVGSSLAIDSTGKIHICYHSEQDELHRSLKYATNRSGSWETEMIVAGGAKPSLALDKNDKAHISFAAYTDSDKLQYATNITGSWVIETVDGIGGWYSSSLALDSSDKVHISYFGQPDDNPYGRPFYNLKHATNASGYWEKETIDSSGCSGEFTSIAIDSHGKVHISYDDCNYDLKYARQCPETDIDCDEISNDDDNCHYVYNPNQEDFYPPGCNGIGDACDCEGNFNCSIDQDVDGSDAALFKADFGRSTILEPCTGESPCNGDFSCNGNVDGTDAALFKADFGRSSMQNPCPVCEAGVWCVY